MKYKEIRFKRLVAGPILLTLLIAVSILPTPWERSAAHSKSYKEQNVSNVRNQIGIAVFRPKVRSGVIKPVVSHGGRRKSILGGIRNRIPGSGDNNNEPNFELEVEYDLETLTGDNVLLKEKVQGKARIEEDAVAEVVRQMAFSIINKARETIALQAATVADSNPRPDAEVSNTPVKTSGEYSKDRPRLVVQTSHSTWVTDYAYNPDGSLLATMGSDGVVKLWSATKGKEINTFPGFRTVGIAFSPDGKNLAILSKEGIVRIFDTATGALIRKMSELTVSSQDSDKNDEIGAIGLMNIIPVSMAYDRDGSILVTGGDRGIRIWDVSSGRTKQTIPGSVKLLALSPDGKIVAGAPEDKKSEIRLFSTSDGQDISAVDAEVEVVTAMAFSHDGKSLVYGSRNGSIKLLNVNSSDKIKNKIKKEVIVDKCDKEFARARKIGRWGKIVGLEKKTEDILGILPAACQIDRAVSDFFKSEGTKQSWTQRLSRAGANFWARSIRSVSLNPDRDLIAYVSADISRQAHCKTLRGP